MMCKNTVTILNVQIEEKEKKKRKSDISTFQMTSGQTHREMNEMVRIFHRWWLK